MSREETLMCAIRHCTSACRLLLQCEGMQTYLIMGQLAAVAGELRRLFDEATDQGFGQKGG